MNASDWKRILIKVPGNSTPALAEELIPTRLKEGLVKDTLKAFEWPRLERHLASIDFQEDAFAELLGHIRRANDLILKRPDPRREKARDRFVGQLSAYISGRLSASAVEELQSVLATLARIEDGYHEIVRALKKTDAAKLLPQTQVAAAIFRANFACHKLNEEILLSASRRKQVTLPSFRIERDDGSTLSPDGLLTGIVDVAAMTLKLLGHQHGWFDADQYLMLPKLSEPTKDEVFRSGLTEALAASWRNWERMEQRYRFLGGEIRVLAREDAPVQLSGAVETVLEYDHVGSTQRLDQLANQRLNERMVQTFQEMSLQTNVEGKVFGIDEPLGLPPGQFVSAQEAHASVALCEMLGYSIVDDQDRPCGLRLTEWIRGYAALGRLAHDRCAGRGVDTMRVVLPRQDLIAMLERVGLEGGAAERFIEEASFRSSSRDLFDQPLIRMEDGSVVLFLPGILAADPARVTLSAIGSREEKLGKKGKAFERETLKFFRGQGLVAEPFKFSRDGEEFEYDILLSWGDYVFVLECKNRTLSGHHPVLAYYFDLEMASAVKQVGRLATALVANAEIVLKRTGIDVHGKAIIPCVVNSLPFARPGRQDGTFVTDASALKRFFQERYFHVVRPHHVSEKAAVILHRIAIASLWKGEAPTPDDLVEYLEDPLQLRLTGAHSTVRRHAFDLGERTVAIVSDIVHEEMKPESVAKLFGVDPASVEREGREMTKAIARASAHAKRKAARDKERAIRETDRAWRRGQQTR